MRVTMLVRCLAMMRGGGETRHLAWAHELTALGVDVDIITGRPLVARPRFRVDRAITVLRSPYARDFVYRFQRKRGFGRLTMLALHLDEEWFCRAAWRRIAAAPNAPDLVHAHALHQAARLRRGDMPVVITLPGPPNRRYHLDLAQADALVADGWAADHLPDQIGRHVDRVTKGVDAHHFRPDGPSMRNTLRLDGKRVVLTVARLVPIKRVSMLVDAFASVREGNGDAHLLIVGDGPEALPLRQRAHGLGIADAVTFTGAVPFDQAPAFYRAADVFALSSSFDNSPNVVLEAMASGLPVVSTEVGGVAEFLNPPAGGLIVPTEGVGALAAAILRFVDDLPAAVAAGEHNRQRAAVGFSWRASTLQLFGVYQRAIAEREQVRATA